MRNLYIILALLTALPASAAARSPGDRWMDMDFY